MVALQVVWRLAYRTMLLLLSSEAAPDRTCVQPGAVIDRASAGLRRGGESRSKDRAEVTSGYRNTSKCLLELQGDRRA